ncbi:hypothetical protein [Sphingomonas sp.]|uniref:hypothetical protein n=1 Tax=Sphingomonas sp. TaxID=28214 RepID=UPI003CC5A32F
MIESTPAIRRYTRSVMLLSVAYALILFGTVGFFRDHPRISDVTAYAIAALPALPIIGIIMVIGRYLIEERDEYLRMLMARQALIATGITLSIATLWGFIEDVGLAPHIPAYHVAVLWFAGFGVGALVNKLLERRGAA